MSRNSAGDLVWREGLLAVHAALSLTESTEPGTSPSAESTARDVIDTIRADGDRYAQVCSEAAELRVATHGITSVPSEDVIREHAEAGGKWTLVGCSDPAYNRAFMGKYEALNAARSLRRSGISDCRWIAMRKDGEVCVPMVCPMTVGANDVAGKVTQ